MRLLINRVPFVFARKTHLIRPLSTQSAVQELQDGDKSKFHDQLKQFERISKIALKMRTKKPQRPPFVKNILVGRFDTELLTYPQMEMDEFVNLSAALRPIEDYARNANAKQESIQTSMEDLKNLEVFGLRGPQSLGGREFTYTESLRFLETIGQNTAVVHPYVASEFLGMETLMRHASEATRDKYLRECIKGEMLFALCITEEQLDESFMKTGAKLSLDKKTWVISGKKVGVINGNLANAYLVLAVTSVIKGPKTTGKCSLFLVDRNAPGVTVAPGHRLDAAGNHVCDVTFDHTPIPAENLIGQLNDPDKAAGKLLADLRLAQGTACISLIKQVLNGMVAYAIDQKSMVPIADTELVQSTIADVAKTLYSLESMTYFTSFLLDQYEEQDCELESLLVKVYGVRAAVDATLKAIELMGHVAYRDQWVGKLHAAALIHQIMGESGNSLRVIGALIGLQHAGREMQDIVKIIRNPFFHSTQIIKRLWTSRKDVNDQPKLKMLLCEYLHPSLRQAADELEYCVYRMQFATETILGTHGQNVWNKHADLLNYTECIMTVFAMAASIGRASRSYCNGQQNAEYEISLANCICHEGMLHIKRAVQLFHEGRTASGFELNLSAAKRMFACKQYFPLHPISRNF